MQCHTVGRAEVLGPEYVADVGREGRGREGREGRRDRVVEERRGQCSNEGQ